MELPPLLPALGAPVSTAVLNLDQVDQASPGELLHAGLQLVRMATGQMADPSSFHELPTFRDATGADWSGFQPTDQPPPEAPGAAPEQPREQSAQPAAHTSPETPAADTAAAAGSADAGVPGMVVPENYYDTIQALGLLLGQLENVTEAANTIVTGYVHRAIGQQARYFGAPVGATPFRDAGQYMQHTRRWSGTKSKKYIARVPLVTYTPGGDPTSLFCQPTYPQIAAAFLGGRISGEIIDRFVSMHTSLRDYATEVGEPVGYMEQVLQAFQPTLVEAAETATPEAFSKIRTSWMDQIAHAINADGPSPSQVLRKPPDNAIKTKRLPGGGGRIWMDATAEVFHQFKNFSLHMLKASSTPAPIPDDLINLIRPTTHNHDTPDEEPGDQPADDDDHQAGSDSADQDGQHATTGAPGDQHAGGDVFPDDLEDLPTLGDPTAVTAEDENGTPYTAQTLDEIDPLTAGQKLAALLIGMFRTVLRMDPKDVGVKRSHGAAAHLVIVQDIETAYRSLGIPPLPPDAQRPPGLAGLAPPVPGDSSVERDPTAGRARPRRWTPFRSQTLNTGPIHPADAELLACDSALSGHIWDGPDTVLNQRRTHRLFTPTQRRAILARDRGCQAPGCTTPAVLCDVHHITEWHNGGTTDETNAITLCSYHHTGMHLGNWTIHRINDLSYFQPAPWLDPYQPMLRNLYWNN